MAIRLRYKIDAAISSNSSEEKDLGNGQFEVVIDTQKEGGSWRTKVFQSVTDLPLQMGNIGQVRYILIRTTPVDPNTAPVPIKIKLDDTANTPIEIKPMDGSKEGYFLLTAPGVLNIFATNESAAIDMYVTVYAVGD